MILVTGFGAFADVSVNPTAQLARALRGRRVFGETIQAVVLPVSYERGLDLLVRTAQQLEPSVVIGLGLARSRSKVSVERTAVRACSDEPDVDGKRWVPSHPGPAEVHATLDPRVLVHALGAELSNDAGRYVCNAWLYTAVTRLSAPAAFVHIPAAGLDPDLLCVALSAIGRLSARRLDAGSAGD